MAPFRPSNLNKRLVSETGGNGGVIGPRKLPYDDICLGCRCGGGDASNGIFRMSENQCASKKPFTDYKGFLLCCATDCTKWFVAPSCTEVSRSWYCGCDAVGVATSLMGDCGWFVPNCGQLQNPGYVCCTYWDSVCPEQYWTSEFAGFGGAFSIDMTTGNQVSHRNYPNYVRCVRAFRCV